MKGKLIIFLVMLFVSIGALSLPAAAFDNPGSIKGIVRAATGGAQSQSTVISNARLTLTNIDLPDFLLTTLSDDSGAFIFDNLPTGKYTLKIEADGLPTVSREIVLASGATLTVEVDLTVAVSETVTVRDEEGLLSISETSTSNIVRAETLKSQPFKEDDYQGAIPLTPGVVQDADGKDYLKGTRAGQSLYTVNGADVIDPITGEAAFEAPLESAQSIQIEENPYSAEFGRFTGGVTNLETKGGGDKFKISMARFFPTLRNFFSTRIESFRPRVTLSGPVVKNRFYFLQSFEYRYRRTNVPNLDVPLDSTVLERFSSFTQFDFTINKSNQLKFNFAFFPQKIRFLGLDTFNPAETTPNVKQPGYLVSFSEQAVFKNTSFLVSAFSYKTSDIEVLPQGSLPLTLMPQINRGNYFANTSRRTGRLQFQEDYYFKTFEFGGKHSPKIGIEFDRTNLKAQFRYNTIFLRRVDDTLAQRIDFTAPGQFDYDYSEASAYFQDRLVVNSKLTLDMGVRFDYDGVNGGKNVAPRFSFLFLPLKNDRTVVRGGIGLFYDRALPVAGYFGSQFNGAAANTTAVPQRIVTNFAANGTTILAAPRFFNNQVAEEIDSPRSVRFSLQIDRGITKELTVRVGYLQRRTTDDLLIQPFEQAAGSGALFLSSSGRASYRELQFVGNYTSQRYGNWNASYVISSARGDLNTADVVLGDFPSFVVRPNEYRRLPFDAPHRFIIYGQVDLPLDIRIAPLFEIRSGFPFSAVNERLEFIGARNEAGRFPTYLSLDLQITKGFDLPFFDNKRIRVGVALFNLTNNFNPRDVQNNVTSPNFREFYNSVGTGVKAKFDIDF